MTLNPTAPTTLPAPGTNPVDPSPRIGQRLQAHQTSLQRQGRSLSEDIEARYLRKWRSPALMHVLRIRTALVSGMTDHLIREGLLNLERVSLSLVTDPLAHDVESLATIPYRQSTYVATHSMIYAKFLACLNPHLTGIFVDSPNLRLELPDPEGRQRGRYLLDFSQLDLEVRRSQSPDLETSLNNPGALRAHLEAEQDRAYALLEGMVRAGVTRIQELAADSVAALEVRLDLPPGPFPVFHLDTGVARYGKARAEAGLGLETASPFFWVRGLLRENYDLVYPYLHADGSRRPLVGVPSRDLFNYDLCVKGQGSDGTLHPALEVLSGGLREWLPEAIVGRLLDHRLIPEAPRFVDGELVNVAALGGYAPFLEVVCRRNDAGRPAFPATFGAGIGIERLLWALLRGPHVRTIDDVTFFGKNPDSADLFLF